MLTQNMWKTCCLGSSLLAANDNCGCWVRIRGSWPRGRTNRKKRKHLRQGPEKGSDVYVLTGFAYLSVQINLGSPDDHQNKAAILRCVHFTVSPLGLLWERNTMRAQWQHSEQEQRQHGDVHVTSQMQDASKHIKICRGKERIICEVQITPQCWDTFQLSSGQPTQVQSTA